MFGYLFLITGLTGNFSLNILGIVFALPKQRPSHIILLLLVNHKGTFIVSVNWLKSKLLVINTILSLPAFLHEHNKTEGNTTQIMRRSRWRCSSTMRRSLTTASSTSGSSPTWPHEPLCMTSSDVAATWTRSRAAAPRCPSSSMGTSWSLPMSVTLGLFWAPHPTTVPSRRPAYRPFEAQSA
ncbi:hypothetical protein ACJX0J_041068, partial [Zea mays]